MRNDCYATFMAKPMANQPGSALHIHQSVVSRETGQNIFSENGDGPASAAFRHHLGGLQRYLFGRHVHPCTLRQFLSPPGP